MNKKDYLQPRIKSCDYWVRNRLMIDINPGDTTSVVLAKPDFDDIESTSDDLGTTTQQKSVWDD